MLGFLRAELLDLTIRDYNSYGQTFRLLRKAAAQDYGFLGQLAVTEEFLILQVLTAAQVDEPRSTHPYYRKYQAESVAIKAARFSAAVSIIMLPSLLEAKKEAVLRVLPPVRAGLGLRMALARVFNRRARRVLRTLGFDPKHFDCFVAEEQALAQHARTGDDPPVAELFGELFGFTAILAQENTNLKASRLLGEAIGRSIDGRLELYATRNGEECERFIHQARIDLQCTLEEFEFRRYDKMVSNFLEAGLLGNIPEVVSNRTRLKGVRSLVGVRLSGECNEDCSSCTGDNDASCCKDGPCHCG